MSKRECDICAYTGEFYGDKLINRPHSERADAENVDWLPFLNYDAEFGQEFLHWTAQRYLSG